MCFTLFAYLTCYSSVKFVCLSISSLLQFYYFPFIYLIFLIVPYEFIDCNLSARISAADMNKLIQMWYLIEFLFEIWLKRRLFSQRPINFQSNYSFEPYSSQNYRLSINWLRFLLRKWTVFQSVFKFFENWLIYDFFQTSFHSKFRISIRQIFWMDSNIFFG